MRRIEGNYFESLEYTIREKNMRVGDIQKYLQREREREREKIYTSIYSKRKKNLCKNVVII